jgi:DNA-binding MarR family transcriptional regulator
MAEHQTAPFRRPKRRRYTFDERVQLVDKLTDHMKSFDCRFTRLLGNLNADFGVTRARLRILDCVIRHPGWNISRIAYDLGLTRQTVSRTVRAMHVAGLLDLQTGSDRRSQYPRLTIIGRVVAKIRLTQAHEWSHRLLAAVDTTAVSAAGWFFETLLFHLPERLDVYAIDAERLPSGMPPSFEEARRRRQPQMPRPVHPVLADGDGWLWADCPIKRDRPARFRAA